MMPADTNLPGWAKKNVVGALLRRGWVIHSDGLRGRAGSPDFFIPKAKIIESNGPPEKEAIRLAHESGAPRRYSPKGQVIS
jgi:hypothetical protein